jgi:hypothetical protein
VDVARVAGVWFDFSAKPADIRSQVLGFIAIFETPDGLKERPMVENATGVGAFP